jgi:hypothetical protein
MIYAGIGSRKTPSNVLLQMQAFAAMFAYNGHTLRSGHAVGADTAFEIGHRSVTFDKMEIFKIDDAKYPLHPAWFEMAYRFHPAWKQCGEYARMAHARNCPIVMGTNLDKPVDFILCWTPNGGPTGGTGQALRIAEHYKIPVFNMFDPLWMTNFVAFLKSKEPVI